MERDTDLTRFLGMSLSEKRSIADKLRRRYCSPDIRLCGIINAKSGMCSEDCAYCAQSRFNDAKAPVYGLIDPDSAIKRALHIQELGAQRIGIVTSGRSLSSRDIDGICHLVESIKNATRLEVCASLGAISRSEMKRLKDAGVTRYHHNIETSRRHYKAIVSTHPFEERIETIEKAKCIGLSVCSGGILGMGEGIDDWVDMARELERVSVDSVPINLLIPLKGTRMEKQPLISQEKALEAIALFRYLLKDRDILLIAGREHVFKEEQHMPFISGANGFMVGGYLTVKGQSVDADARLKERILKLWDRVCDYG